MTSNADICAAALRKIGVASSVQPISAEDLRDALAELGRMLSSWQNMRFNLWTYAESSVPLTLAASYVLTPRPVEVHDVRIRRGAIDMPMHQMTRQEYFALPQKASTGFPTTFYVDRQATVTTLYVWPLLSAVSGQTLEITYTREIVVPLTGDDIDVPTQWETAAVYGLASRLADDHQVDAGNVTARAQYEMDQAQAFDREGSVFFVGDEYRE